MLSTLAKRLGAQLGLQPLPSWEQELAHKLRILSSERNTSVEDLISRINVDPLLLHEVSGALTVNETFFLREPRHFDVALSHLIACAERGVATVWSAGCSSGEEPYSLAILLMRHARHLSGRVHIRASDISRACLSKARKGVYGSWSFRSVPAWLQSQYFRPVGPAQWQLDEPIRERVDFFEETIQAGLSRIQSDSVDVIFFRNVSIYADRAALPGLFAGFHRILKPGGLLIQSVSDVNPPSDLFCIVPAPVLGIFSAPKNIAPAPPPAVKPAAAIEETETHHPRASISKVPDTRPVPRLNEPPSPSEDPSKGLADMLRLASEFADSGDLARALPHIERAIATAPANVDARFLRGKLLLATRATDEAICEFRRVVFLAPNHKLGRYWLALAFMSMQMPRKATLELTELTRRLAKMEAMDLLEDGATQVEELRAAIEAQQRTLQ